MVRLPTTEEIEATLASLPWIKELEVLALRYGVTDLVTLRHRASDAEYQWVLSRTALPKESSRREPDDESVVDEGDLPANASERDRHRPDRLAFLRKPTAKDVSAEFDAIRAAAVALVDRLDECSPTVLELMLKTTSREHAIGIIETARLAARHVDTLAICAKNRPEMRQLPKPKRGRRGFGEGEIRLVRELAALWHDLSGEHAAAYYNDDTGEGWNRGAEFVRDAAEIITRTRITMRQLREHR
jgi:hypothetical protein